MLIGETVATEAVFTITRSVDIEVVHDAFLSVINLKAFDR